MRAVLVRADAVSWISVGSHSATMTAALAAIASARTARMARFVAIVLVAVGLLGPAGLLVPVARVGGFVALARSAPVVPLTRRVLHAAG
jgi:hypothetical protein